jgi:ubiquinone/menaquinone biosynthesis C-methylase UbiE
MTVSQIDPYPGHRYLMEGSDETDRLRFKTERVLIARHLDWAAVCRGESLIDIGCGSGELVLTAASRCAPARVTGLDTNAQRLKEILGHARRLHLANVDVHEAYITARGSSCVPDGAYDHAIARFVLKYQKQPLATVREMARIVKPGGRVTLIDIEGNAIRHHAMDATLHTALTEIIDDLRFTGFDPDIGAKLPALAHAAGLSDIRHEIEPYHRIVGTPDERTAKAWQRKIEGLRHNYLHHLFPHKQHLAWVFDAFIAFIRSEDTMTWSLLHLVQGTAA